MKEKRYGTLGGLTVPVQIYASFDEADKAAGKPGVLLDIANDNLHYRGGPAAATREAIVTVLDGREDLVVQDPSDAAKQIIVHKAKPYTGKDGKVIHITLEATERKDEKGQPIMTWAESEGKFVARFLASTGWQDKEGNASLEQIQPIIDKWAKHADAGGPLMVDAKEPERKPKAPPRLSEEDKALATEFIDGKKSLAKFGTAALKYNIVIAKLGEDREANITAVAWNVKAYFKAKSDEAKLKAKNEAEAAFKF